MLYIKRQALMYVIGNNTIYGVLCALILVGASVLAPVAAAQEPLSPEQLVSLIKASQERFVSLDLTIAMKADLYQQDSPETTRKAFQRARVTTLWTPTHSYGEIVSEMHVPDWKWEIAETWTKQYTQNGEEKDGVIQRGKGSLQYPDGWPLFRLLWDLWGLPTKEILRSEPVVTWSPDEKLYSFDLKYQGVGFSMMVDPAMGYVPVSKKFVGRDGNTISEYAVSAFKEVAPGVWLPTVLRTLSPYMTPGSMLETEYTIEHATVNEPIAEERMKLVFPHGTRVQDRMVGRKYRIVGEGAPEELSVNGVRPGEATLTSDRVQLSDLTRSIDEKSLQRTADAASQMVDKAGGIPQPSYAGYWCAGALALAALMALPVLRGLRKRLMGKGLAE